VHGLFFFIRFCNVFSRDCLDPAAYANLTYHGRGAKRAKARLCQLRPRKVNFTMAGKKGRPGPKPTRDAGTPAEIGKCTECEETKPGAEFYPNSGRRTLLSSVCRACTPIANLKANYRRAIRDDGAEAFQKRITELEQRLELMREALANAPLPVQAQPQVKKRRGLIRRSSSHDPV
jgi:hypothetical protein